MPNSLKLYSNPRSGDTPKILGKKIELFLGSEDKIVKIKFGIEHKGSIMDAFELATKALESWERFI